MEYQEYSIMMNEEMEKFVVDLKNRRIEIPFGNLEWPQLTSKGRITDEINEVVKKIYSTEKVKANYSQQVEEKLEEIALRNLLNFD